MTLEDAVQQACAEVGVIPPSSLAYGRWIKADTLSGRNGKGDGRVMINDACVTSLNWQTGLKATVWLKDASSPSVRRQMRDDIEKQAEERRTKAAKAALVAENIVHAATMQTHDYLARKGFPEEQTLVIGAADVRRIGANDVLGIDGKYLVCGDSAIVIPARHGSSIRTVQLIWESGEKKFIADGEAGGTSHRIASGRDTWLCEGFATGLSLRAGLKSLGHQATILCCFSAANIARVAETLRGRTYIVADHDKPIPQLDGLGTGEYYARRTKLPFVMPPDIGFDLNDMHQRDGIFAVQRLICDFLKGARK